MKISYPVLLVEDNVYAQYAARLILEHADCRVCVAENAEKALAYLQDRYFALVVMDIALPDGDGIDITKALQANTQSPNQTTPVVALTAHYTQPDHKKRCLDAGMLDMFAKPVTPKNIAIALLYLHPTDQLPIHDEAHALTCFPDVLTADTTLQCFIRA
ncbi:MAG: response regulator [Gammaproteobacteria bacterium]|nr:response regulator [Gammaproteobacteria bacterium]